ncbi:MAG: ABC transporter substrate-binding protein [Actinobacteria bacterium HGW-Actinobacteria-1]|jgi:branched-chain amino acid transport system substrate-binding protein|nr:MAG: ABC transporter substrate-binding protein [Actinobacteria bacterium HGW-Actinobacteria-1]
MKTRRRVVAAALVAMLMVTTVAGCSSKGSSGSATGEGSAEPYRIGAIVSLSGSYAGLGTPEQKAIEMEMKRINDAGGINGRQVEVIFEDDATDPAKAQAAVARLLEQENVIAVIGATGTSQTMALRDDIDRAGVPQVSMAGGSVITAEFDKNVFQTPWPNRIVVPFTLKALKDRGLVNVAVISDTGGYGKDGHDLILKDADTAGVKIVADETFNPGDTDMTAQLTKIKAASPDVVLMWNAGKEAAIVAKNIKQLGMSVPLVGSPGNGRREFIEGAGDAAEGFRFAAGKILVPEAYGEGTPAFEVAQKFIADYSFAYGVAPDIFAGHAFDAFLVVTDALKRVEGEATPASLRDAIEATDGLVGVGGTFAYSPEDHNGLTEEELVFYRVDGATWVLDK